MSGGGLWKVQIEQTRDGYHYTIEEPHRSTIAFRGDLTVPAGIRSEIASSFQELLNTIGPVRSAAADQTEISEPHVGSKTEPAQLGQRIFNFLISSECQNYLEQIDSAFVKISTNDVEIPWELMHDGDDFFAVKNAVGRMIEAKKTIAQPTRPKKDQQRALLIGDPGLDLPGAADEIEELSNMFETSSRVMVDTILQEEATSHNLIFEHLESNYYDIIHYAGHTSFDADNPEQSKIHLNDTDITAQYLLNLLNTPPLLMFLNSCSSSTSGGINYWEQEGCVSGLASSVITSGVDHYVGAMWPISDIVSQQVSRFFYEQLFNGTPVGAALQTARERVIQSHQDALSPASFILYGDPRTTAVSGTTVSKTDLLNKTSYESSRKLCSEIGLGSIDIGFLGLNQALYRIKQGLDVRIIGVSAYSDGGIGIVASSESDIEKIADLAGQTVATAPNRESTVNRWFDDVLVEADVNPKDVLTIEMNGSDHYKNLRNDRISAIVTWDPWKSLSEMSGRLVTDDKSASLKSYEVIVASEKLVENDLESVKSLLNTHMNIIDEIKNAEQYPETYANRLGIEAEVVGMQDDGYVRPTRERHFDKTLEASLRETIEAELEFLYHERFIDDTEFQDDIVDFSHIPDQSPPETIALEEVTIGHNDSLACITGIERGYYV